MTPVKQGLEGAAVGLHLEGGVSAGILLGILVYPSPLTLLLPSRGQGPPLLCLRVMKAQSSRRAGLPEPQRERSAAKDTGDAIEKEGQTVRRAGLPVEPAASSTSDRQRKGPRNELHGRRKQWE